MIVYSNSKCIKRNIVFLSRICFLAMNQFEYERFRLGLNKDLLSPQKIRDSLKQIDVPCPNFEAIRMK